MSASCPLAAAALRDYLWAGLSVKDQADPPPPPPPSPHTSGRAEVLKGDKVTQITRDRAGGVTDDGQQIHHDVCAARPQPAHRFTADPRLSIAASPLSKLAQWLVLECSQLETIVVSTGPRESPGPSATHGDHVVSDRDQFVTEPDRP